MLLTELHLKNKCFNTQGQNQISQVCSCCQFDVNLIWPLDFSVLSVHDTCRTKHRRYFKSFCRIMKQEFSEPPRARCTFLKLSLMHRGCYIPSVTCKVKMQRDKEKERWRQPRGVASCSVNDFLRRCAAAALHVTARCRSRRVRAAHVKTQSLRREISMFSSIIQPPSFENVAYVWLNRA